MVGESFSLIQRSCRSRARGAAGDTFIVIQLIVTPHPGGGIDTVAHGILNTLQVRLRAQCMDIYRDDTIDGAGQCRIRTFTLDPPSAGVLTIAQTAMQHGSRSIVFSLTGMVAVTFAAALRALADDLRRGDPRMSVTVNSTLSGNPLASPPASSAAREPVLRSVQAHRDRSAPWSLTHHHPRR